MGASHVPVLDVDLFAERNLLNPHPIYKSIRDAGSVVWLDTIGYSAMGRYDDVRKALRDWELFSSAHGTTLNEVLNKNGFASLISSDNPYHLQLRKVYAKPLQPKEVQTLTERIQREADGLIDRLLERGRIDAAHDLAPYLPLTIISSFVGLPLESWKDIVIWNEAVGNVLGPDHSAAEQNYKTRFEQSLSLVMQMNDYLEKEGTRERLTPGSWGAELFAAAERGDIPHEAIRGLLIEYIGPSIETTISATGSLIWLLAQHPEEWRKLKADPSLALPAVIEAVRLETPVPWFSRTLTRDHEIDGVQLSAGSRMLLIYAAANRDERKYPQPDAFDIGRNASDHLGWGFGMHACAGMHLARLELSSILRALLAKVDHVTLDGEPERLLNSSIRAFKHLPITLHPIAHS